MQKPIPQISFKGNLQSDSFQKSVTDNSDPMKCLDGLQVVLTIGKNSMKNVDKLYEREKVIKELTGDKLERLKIEKDKFSPGKVFIINAELKNRETYKEYFNENLDRIAEEKTYFQKDKKTGDSYKIVKTKDLINNTVSKVRTKYTQGDLSQNRADKNILLDSVKIYKDDKNNITKKDYIYPSVLEGVYDQKTIFPDGSEKYVSKTKSFDNLDGMKVIQKDMTSPDGTQTNYRYEYDNKGNRLLEYKITDKKGNVLMNLNKTFEIVSDKKFISSDGDKVYEMTFEDDKLSIKERGQDKTTEILFDKKICGTEEAKQIAKNVLKKMPGDQLTALNKTIKSMRGTKDDAQCKMGILNKHLTTVDDLFSALHELGHAKDFKNAKSRNLVQSYTNKKGLQKVFNEECENFKKSFPNIEKEHLKYFLTETEYSKDSYLFGLGEIVAEVNGLKDSHPTNEILGARVQYLQQNFPKTIAYLNNKL